MKKIKFTILFCIVAIISVAQVPHKIDKSNVKPVSVKNPTETEKVTTDTSRQKNLPVQPINIDAVLSPFDGKWYCELVQYEGLNPGKRHNIEIQGQMSTDFEIDNSKWTMIGIQHKANRSNEVFFTLALQIKEGELKQSAFNFRIDFDKWAISNYLLIPAIVYNGNRFRALEGGYCPKYPEDVIRNPKSELMFSDNPRLNKENKESKIEILTGHASTPSITFFSPELKKGFVLLTEQRTEYGDLGYTFIENADKTKASIIISVPAVRSRIANFGGFRKSDDKAKDWKAGDKIMLRFYVETFDVNNIPEFLMKFFEKRKLITKITQTRNLAPMSKIYEYASKAIDEHRWRETRYGNFYHMDFSNRFQLGWVGGMMTTYAMMFDNNPQRLQRAASTIDFVLKNMQGKAGYFYGYFDFEKGKVLTEYNRENLGMVAMVRKNADVLFWLCKQFMLLKEQGNEKLINPKWEYAAKVLAQAFVKTWDKYGELGQYIDPETGEIIIFNSTAGAIVPAGLVLASKYFDEPKFLTKAIEIANHYYNRDVAGLGLTAGYCGDISQDADSESAFGLLESMIALYWATNDKQWLDKAEVVAALCATWVLSYDYVFPKESDLGKLDAKVAGAVWASVQNKHAAPGICTSSGDCLFKLYRATGKREYAQLLKEIQHAHTEVIELPGRPTVSKGSVDWGNKVSYYGAISERISTNDAEGKDRVGQLPSTSFVWNETNGMFMAYEIPGIYLKADKMEMFVFDHVEAQLKKKDENTIILTISNKTEFPAVVSLFAENSEQAKKFPGYIDFLKWKRIHVDKNKTSEVVLNTNGTILSINENVR